MIDGAAWPDIDEDLLRRRSDDLRVVLNSVVNVLGKWQSLRPAVFNPSTWSGSAASAADEALGRRIGEMSQLHDHLLKAIAWYELVAAVIVKTKQQIVDNVEHAHKVIEVLKSDSDLSDEELENAIQVWITATHALNTVAVAVGAGEVPKFNAWQPPAAPPPPAQPTAPVSLPREESFTVAPVGYKPPAITPAEAREQPFYVAPAGPPAQSGVLPPVKPSPADAPTSPAPGSVGSGGGGSASPSGGGSGSPEWWRRYDVRSFIGHVRSQFVRRRDSGNRESRCGDRQTSRARPLRAALPPQRLPPSNPSHRKPRSAHPPLPPRPLRLPPHHHRPPHLPLPRPRLASPPPVALAAAAFRAVAQPAPSAQHLAPPLQVPPCL